MSARSMRRRSRRSLAWTLRSGPLLAFARTRLYDSELPTLRLNWSARVTETLRPQRKTDSGEHVLNPVEKLLECVAVKGNVIRRAADHYNVLSLLGRTSHSSSERRPPDHTTIGIVTVNEQPPKGST